MRVKIYFKNNETIEGEINDRDIVIPVLVKEYTGYQHSLVITINPNSVDYRQIDKARRKGNEHIRFEHTTLTLVGEPNEYTGWQVDRSNITGSMLELFGGQWASRLESFIRTYCMSSGLEAKSHRTNMSETFYLKDGIIANASNCVIHAFGRCRVIAETLDNVIVYFHE